MTIEVTLTVDEAKKLGVIQETLAGRMTVQTAAGILQLSERQVYRLRERVRDRGALGIVHGNQGCPPSNRCSATERERVLRLYQTTYAGYNFSHFAEALEDEEGIVLSRETVRRWLRTAGEGQPMRRVPKHRKRRLRKAREGEMLFLDGSPHHWFGEEHAPSTLLLACDDATGKPLAGLFREQEDRDGCFLVLARLFKRYGLPQCFYLDRASQFTTTRHGGVHAYQTADQPTQFERAMEELQIQLIFAHSPQARGRIERMNGTFQNRLVAEFHHSKIATLPEANRYLNRRFIPAIAKRFGLAPRESQSAWRDVPTDVELFDILCVKTKRTVANDNTIAYNGLHFQLYPDHGRRHFAQARVEVWDRPDGKIRIVHPKLGPIRTRKIASEGKTQGAIS